MFSTAPSVMPVAALVSILVGAAALGCSPDKTSRTLLLAPHEGHFSIHGQVRLTGALTDGTGGPLGDRIVDVANDVKIHVEGPSDFRDSVFTHDGIFTIGVDHPGLYRVSCCVVSGDTAGHIDVIVTEDTAIDAGMLTIGSPAGNIATHPNPFGASGVAVEATTAETQRVEVFVSTLFGYRLWNYAVDNFPAGYLHVHWPGLDDAGDPVPDGPYWAVIHADGAYSYSLVFKESSAPLRSKR